jgi:K+-sensing histidine kinase KdpD
MKRLNLTHLIPLLKSSFLAVLTAALTALFLLVGRRDIVGEGVIALLLLLAVMGSAYQWGMAGGISAAVTAALAFDYLFIPPYYTFTIGSLEGWLIFLIFFVVAIVVVERIQSTLSKARTSEREAVMMYEFSSLLANLRTQEAIAHNVARFLSQHTLAGLVRISIQPKGQTELINAQEPVDAVISKKPDRILPLLNSWGLVGEIQIWSSEDFELPAIDSRLFRNIAIQMGVAIERVQIREYEYQSTVASKTAKI